MKVFDRDDRYMKLYLHFSYSFSMAFIVLITREVVPLVLGHASTPLQFLTPEFLISLAVGTALIALMLYLHLPNMINRCFNIGRRFGL